jgi:hypothetical protein
VSDPIVNYGSDYPLPRLIKGQWYVPYAITSSTDEDGVVIYEAKEAISKTLFEHDLRAVISDADEADIVSAFNHGVRLQRAKEYPPMQDYLDGIAKDDDAQVQAYKDACLAVKAKYPFLERKV